MTDILVKRQGVFMGPWVLPGALLLFFLLSGCSGLGTHNSDRSMSGDDGRHGGHRVLSLKDTIQLEDSDRMNRISRLSDRQDLPHPEIDDLTLPAKYMPSVGYDIPVIRVRYPAAAFFATDSWRLSSQARHVLNVIAHSMSLDMPDVSLLVVGHTDSRASVAYNQTLSERRARAAVDYLKQKGVPVKQLNFIGMSERQPIARNDTSEGRARNRRVEFLISSYERANLYFAKTRSINCSYLDDKEFDIPYCLNLGVLRKIPVDINDKIGKVDIDDTRVETGITDTDVKVQSSTKNKDVAVNRTTPRVAIDTMGSDSGSSNVHHLDDAIPVSPPAKDATVAISHKANVVTIGLQPTVVHIIDMDKT